jgi:hypothetical protein
MPVDNRDSNISHGRMRECVDAWSVKLHDSKSGSHDE